MTRRVRPASPIGRHVRNAEATRRYRARKRIEKEARRDPSPRSGNKQIIEYFESM